MNDQIQNLLSQVPASKSGGKYLDQLTPESREVLGIFEKWLVETDNKSEATARAYKGYVAQALVLIEEDPDVELSTDVKSAINALRRFQLSGAAPSAVTDDDEA
jgi:hypothetical protein